jgi:hypothetical protein
MEIMNAASVFTLKMEAAWSSKTLIFCYTPTQSHNLEDHSSLNLCHCESLRSHQRKPCVIIEMF